MSLNKYCLGCGSLLQNSNPKENGYIVNLDKDFCQRCFKLSHYGQVLDINRFKDDDLIFSILNKYKNDAIYFLIVDVYDSLCLLDDSLFSKIKDFNIVLIINKIDLLPKNINENTINERYLKIGNELKKKYSNLLDIFLTYKDDSSFNDLFFGYLKTLSKKKFVFFGKSNAGKSTLLNKLLGTNITTSIYVGTTLNRIELKHGDYTFVDTPGLDDNDNLLTYLSNDELKEYLKYKTIKPSIFQVYEPQTYYLSGLFRITILPKSLTSLIFEGYREDIHRTKFENNDNYFDKHNNEFEYKLFPWFNHEYICHNNRSFIIKGFGVIKIKGDAKIIISINDKITIHESGVL